MGMVVGGRGVCLSWMGEGEGESVTKENIHEHYSVSSCIP